jgi:hypothetical protein
VIGFGTEQQLPNFRGTDAALTEIPASFRNVAQRSRRMKRDVRRLVRRFEHEVISHGDDQATAHLANAFALLHAAGHLGVRFERIRPPQRDGARTACYRTHRGQRLHNVGKHRTNEAAMPRTSKGARLWLRPIRRRGGRVVGRATWIIIDGPKHISTGCFAEQTREAENRLAAYIAEEYSPSRQARDIDRIDVADVLSIYLEDCGPRIADQQKLERCIGRLNDFWAIESSRKLRPQIAELMSKSVAKPVALAPTLRHCARPSITTPKKICTTA